MSEAVENAGEEIPGRHQDPSDRGRPGSNPPAEPQPGAGEGPEDGPDQDPPAQGFGEPDSY